MQITYNDNFNAAGNGQLSIVRMSAMMAIDDTALGGYFLDTANSTFLSSEVGIAIWAEHDGSLHKIDGKTEARLVQSPRGPMVEIWRQESGLMVALFRILCVDVLGIAPATLTRLSEYRDMLAEAREDRVKH